MGESWEKDDQALGGVNRLILRMKMAAKRSQNEERRGRLFLIVTTTTRATFVAGHKDWVLRQ